MPACCECGLGIWGEIALSSSVGVRTRLRSSLPLFNCVATSRKTPAAKKFLECISALQHLYWRVSPHSACHRPSWVWCWLLTASWGLKWLMLTFRRVRLFLSLQQNVKKTNQTKKPNTPKNQTCHLNTNLIKQSSKILEIKAFQMYMFEDFFFFLFLVFCLSYHWNDLFIFSKLLHCPSTLPPTPFSSTCLSAVRKLW